MTTLRHLPPGRAGLVYLRRRLAVAERGAELLETKLRILQEEERRFALQVQRTQRAWLEAAAEADRWGLRAGQVGGARGLRLADSEQLGEVEVQWRSTMGVAHPVHAHYRPPSSDSQTPEPNSDPVWRSRETHVAALAAAAEHAAAATAHQAITRELDATRRRSRALRERWIPAIRESMARRRLQMEEQEHDEGVRLRWSAGRKGRG
jgi:V/A-type H+-transporting ATPase subunit D